MKGSVPHEGVGPADPHIFPNNDPHGRLSLVTDAHTGTTTNSFDNADRVTSVSTPAPASGQAPQITATAYNNMGWVTNK